jgi:amino acid adenylation domain-containing protein
LKRFIDASLQKSLKQTAAQQRTTLVVLLMATMKLLLHRLTGQTDFVVGLGAAGQAIDGKNCLVGHCLNLLPVRTQLHTDATFQDTLRTVKKNVLDAHDHHQCTIGGILQNLTAVPRSPNRAPLVEVTFNVDRDPGAVEFHELDFSCDRNPKCALHFDLFFNIVEGQQGLNVECDYNTDLFDAATIERWLRHYETLLQGIATNPVEILGKIPLLTETERLEMTAGRNAVGRQIPKQQTLHQWFETQVEKTPQAKAMTFEGSHWTYAELNSRANKLAHCLRKLGVGPDVLVGLFVDRTPDILVGILGILKSGGAYLPIDPVYPSERLAFMLEDARVPVLLTQSSLVAELPGIDARILCFDTDRALIENEPDNNPLPWSTPDHLAYVIYTSGSTGKPKGSLITHYNVVRLMRATEEWFHFNENDVWTFFHSHAFDFSVWEIWGALLYGGRLVVVPYLKSRSPEDFLKLLEQERVTVLNQTPSAFKQLVQAELATGVNNRLALRYVIFGGETLEMYSLKPWFERHGDQHPQLVNMYGITETTVHVTHRQLSASDLQSSSVIGFPIPDLQIYILDPYQQPVPIGVAGEIWVGGAGVARGYLERPDLTKQKFLDDFFSNRPGALLYRSGDLARYLPNFAVEYIGRIDDQVKIRGFRIELGEIESVLSRHEAVRQCVVVAHNDRSSDKSLVAYFEIREGKTPSIADLRAYLKRELPDYMVPSAFVPMEKLPLTPNGKIDRKSLPAVESAALQPVGEIVEPRNPLELMIADCWRQVLNVSGVGIHDNFFELGGNSLLAVQVVSRVNQANNVGLTLPMIFQHPTVAGITAAVIDLKLKAADPEEMALLLAEFEEMSDAEAAAELTESEGTTPRQNLR